MAVNPSHFAPGRPGADAVKGLDVSRHPVDSVSWPDAIEFCNKLSVKEGLPAFYARDGDKVTTLGTKGYRLPTEAEWERACRAGTTARWSFGDDESQLEKHAWFAPNSGGRTHAVGELPPNAFGLYDMHGNCTEWVWDLFGGYSASDATDPTGAAASAGRMARGAAFSSPLFDVRSAGRRENAVPGYKANFNTFRVARTISSQSAAGPVRDAADTFSPGSVWKGNKTFRRGAQSPLTVSYELHVRERDGVKFKGHVFGRGPNRNRVEVEGEIDGGKITWRERDDSISRLLTIEGTLSDGTIKVARALAGEEPPVVELGAAALTSMNGCRIDQAIGNPYHKWEILLFCRYARDGFADFRSRGWPNVSVAW